MKKIFLSLFVGLFMPLKVMAADSGSCAPVDENGDQIGNCSWTFDGQTLTISGQGPMKHYQAYEDEVVSWRSTAPWADYGSDVKNVVIQNGVTSVGHYAFYNITAEKIDLPDTITSVGGGAFQGARQVKEFSIPSSVETIGIAAFNNMDSLTSIVIPDSITVLPESSFSSSNNLLSVVMGDQFTSIADTALRNLLANVKIYCTGNVNVCKEKVGEALADRVVQASKQNINGMTYVFDKNGKLVASSGERLNKRIYTVEEASYTMPLVIVPVVGSNGFSFVTAAGTYDSTTREVTPREGVTVADDYVGKVNAIVNEKWKYAKLIITSDYYRSVIK